MTDILERIRAVALLLPEVEERVSAGRPAFFVADRMFAHVTVDRDDGAAPVVSVRAGDGGDHRAGDGAAWVDVTLGDDADWPLVEDRIARGWELTAPRRLLEAGGR